MPTCEMVDHFVDSGSVDAPVRGDLRQMCNGGASTYSAALGWVIRTSVCEGGIDGSLTYHQTETDGARRMINFPEWPCRLLTFGNSFTQGSQVSDGETWQEVLAAHFQEPVRNYGVGGYSVYQAYLRMQAVLSETPARYVILNIWDDDHFRNLDDWRAIRFGASGRFTLPHIRVDDETGKCLEVENRCQTPEELYRLCDYDYIWDSYKNDSILNALDSIAENNDGKLIRYGQDNSRFDGNATARQMAQTEPDSQIRMVYTEKALAASRFVIDKAKEITSEIGAELLVILSFSRTSVADELRGKARFDQSFLDWLHQQHTPFIDLRDAFKSEFEAVGGRDIENYLDRYFIGHHTPIGNSFFAASTRRRLVDWLDPRPLPYQHSHRG